MVILSESHNRWAAGRPIPVTSLSVAKRQSTNTDCQTDCYRTVANVGSRPAGAKHVHQQLSDRPPCYRSHRRKRHDADTCSPPATHPSKLGVTWPPTRPSLCTHCGGQGVCSSTVNARVIGYPPISRWLVTRGRSCRKGVRAYSNVATSVSPGVSRRYSQGAMFSLQVWGTRGSTSGGSWRACRSSDHRRASWQYHPASVRDRWSSESLCIA